MDNLADMLRKSIIDFKRTALRTSNTFDKLTLADMTVFWTMHGIMCQNPQTEQVAIGDLVKHLSLSKPAITQNINKLEDKGLVQRVTLRSDRRATYVQFTNKGKLLFEKEKRNIDDKMAEFVRRMGDEDTIKFIELLNKFRKITEEMQTDNDKKEKGDK
ncbi:MAG TPA: MarR family transcriptional regulator [Clostridiales bacterium]|nr:MarR family transcriptional regulator [Clostridiales bacterium]